MTIQEFIIRLLKFGFDPEAEIYINVYGEIRKLYEGDLRKDEDGDLIINP